MINRPAAFPYITNKEIYAPVDEANRRIDDEIAREKEISRTPYKTRFFRAQYDAVSVWKADGYEARQVTAEMVWHYGVGRDLFLPSEEKAVFEDRNAKLGKSAKKIGQEAKRIEMKARIARDNQHKAFYSNLQLQTIQMFLVGGGSLGPKLAAAYNGAQTGIFAADVYRGGQSEGLQTVAFASLVLSLLLRKRPVGRGGPPQLTMGDVKSIYSYEEGLKHISLWRAAGFTTRAGTSG